MASVLQIKRRINGAVGSPGAPGAKEGELALNFPGAAGTTGKPALWAFDGTAWRQTNPDVNVSVGVAILPGGTAGSATGIGGAWTAFGTKPTDPIIIATFAGSAFVKTGAGGADGDWTALGSSYTLPPLGILSLGGIKIGNTYTPGGGKFISGFDADGTAQWTSPPAASSMKGGIALSAAVPTMPGNGDSYFITAITTPNAGWTTALTAPVVAAAKVGDLLVYGNSAWHLIPNQTDLTAYVPKAGATTMDADASWTFASAANATIINGGANMPKIDQVTLDMGTY